MAWHKPICCLDQEYMYVFDHFCHCTQGLDKFMVTCIDNVSIQGTRIKLRSVRLLCRIRLGLKSVSLWGN